MSRWFDLWHMTGPLEMSLYPRGADSPYRLPWRGGLVRLCIQGNRGLVSHRGREKFAYDFSMPVGSVICAARAGSISYVDVTHRSRGFKASNNLIGIDHGDGTTAWYVHLKLGGVLITEGDHVEIGQPIALSGNVGRSMVPHLHFEVTGADYATVPVTFADVASGQGIPRMFRRYQSGNRRP